MFFYEFEEISKNTFFYRTPLVAASVYRFIIIINSISYYYYYSVKNILRKKNYVMDLQQMVNVDRFIN